MRSSTPTPRVGRHPATDSPATHTQSTCRAFRMAAEAVPRAAHGMAGMSRNAPKPVEINVPVDGHEYFGT